LSSATCLNNVRLWLKMLVYGMLQKTCVGDREKEAAYTKRENKKGVRDPAVLFVDRNTRTTHNGKRQISVALPSNGRGNSIGATIYLHPCAATWRESQKLLHHVEDEEQSLTKQGHFG